MRLRNLSMLAAVLILVSGSAEATVLHGLTVKQLGQRAEAMVTGKVVSVRSENTNGRIETVARVRVRKNWRGAEGRVITVRLLGGQHQGLRVVVAGAATLQRGEKVLLFLYRSDGSWRPLGMFQGVWRLDRFGDDMARASDSGGATLLRSGTGEPAVEISERSVAQLLGKDGVR